MVICYFKKFEGLYLRFCCQKFGSLKKTEKNRPAFFWVLFKEQGSKRSKRQNHVFFVQSRRFGQNKNGKMRSR